MNLTTTTSNAPAAGDLISESITRFGLTTLDASDGGRTQRPRRRPLPRRQVGMISLDLPARLVVGSARQMQREQTQRDDVHQHGCG
jgi:hypothetical protein